MKILVITEDTPLKLMLKEFIKEYKTMTQVDCRVHVAWDTKSALLEIQNLIPDVVIVDIDMKNVQAFEIVSEIRKSVGTEDSAIIVITEDQSEETAIVAYESNIDDLIYKPLQFYTLMIKLNNLLERKAYRNKLKEDKSLLSKYVSGDVAEHVLKNTDNAVNGIYTHVTIMFFDLRNSTALAETINPAVLANFLSEIFDHIMKIIYRNYGSVNNILGDGILATFGFPVCYDNDSLHAIKSIYEIREYIQEYNQKLPEYLPAPIDYGIGVTTGSVFAGNIGTAQRITCTVLGDVVNTAARLQGLTKKGKFDSLIDESTYRFVAPFVRAKSVRVKIRGKLMPQTVFFPHKIDRNKLDKHLAASYAQIENNISGIGEVEYF